MHKSILLFLGIFFFIRTFVLNLLGTGTYFFDLMFLVMLCIYSSRDRSFLLYGIIVAVMAEIIFGYPLGSLSIPLSIISLLNNLAEGFMNISTLLDGASIKNVAGIFIWALIVSYVFIFLSLLTQGKIAYDVIANTNFLHLSVNSIVWIALFGAVFDVKKRKAFMPGWLSASKR